MIHRANIGPCHPPTIQCTQARTEPINNKAWRAMQQAKLCCHSTPTLVAATQPPRRDQGTPPQHIDRQVPTSQILSGNQPNPAPTRRGAAQGRRHRAITHAPSARARGNPLAAALCSWYTAAASKLLLAYCRSLPATHCCWHTAAACASSIYWLRSL